MRSTRLPKKLLSITLAALTVFAVAPASRAQAGVLGQGLTTEIAWNCHDNPWRPGSP
ncbi:hypothetical protein [Paracidovorax cattleyae]|uniref:Uncharacterized protein n=1 Tax=Paracidovorax cattleyae TaxID=80868 RepID=A0A1H0NNQ3_9BURK|nr:hypothetical protein [Paracidovorax cattleyae]MBF9264512.1 hypothetical protein [Paracidovorax cattleyae]SDO94035.1 hypothetical protein SAMN04489708_10579 [Paracidovorax cattleyae]